jgi:hypothetical protein
MSLHIDPASVSAILLATGWVQVSRVGYDFCSYWSAEDGQATYCWTADLDDSATPATLIGPMSTLLAVRTGTGRPANVAAARAAARLDVVARLDHLAGVDAHLSLGKATALLGEDRQPYVPRRLVVEALQVRRGRLQDRAECRALELTLGDE